MKKSKEATSKKIRKLLADELNHVGRIKTDTAWKICCLHFGYSTVVSHFATIMEEMVKAGSAVKERRGVWSIIRYDEFKP